MKRSAIAALLALCATALVGCAGNENRYDYRHFDLEPTDVEPQADGTRVHAAAISTGYSDHEKRLVRSGAPYTIDFAVWGRFEKVEKIDAWLTLNGRKIPFPLDREFDDAGNILLRPFDRDVFFTGKPEYILETRWKSIRTLELHTRFTATVDGVTREYHIVAPFEKSYEAGNAVIIWD